MQQNMLYTMHCIYFPQLNLCMQSILYLKGIYKVAYAFTTRYQIVHQCFNSCYI